MRAIVFFEHGGPEVLQYHEDIAVPEPRADEVLVKVRYAALNRLDNFVRAGWRGLELAKPHVLGADFSGTIASLGADVVDWKIGQRVVANPTLWCGVCPYCRAGRDNQCDRFAILGEHAPGTFAEFVRVPARNLVAIPGDYPDELAAAAPLVAVTAWHMLIGAGQLRAGEKVLVVGAGGGVNSMALQIAQLAGATVYAVAGNGEKARRACELGAERAVDRQAEPDWSKAIWQFTGKRGVDVVVDNVGEATWASSLRVLAKGGRLLCVGASSGYNVPTTANMIFGRHLSIIGSTMGTQAEFAAVMGQVWAGRLKPVVDQVYPLAEYPAALARMLAGDNFGKILLEIG
jgi:NADPH:quinone reductase-like Zn-dependent oxidoreductase